MSLRCSRCATSSAASSSRETSIRRVPVTPRPVGLSLEIDAPPDEFKCADRVAAAAIGRPLFVNGDVYGDADATGHGLILMRLSFVYFVGTEDIFVFLVRVAL